MRRRVFISYRPQDATAFAGRLYEALTEQFGEKNVFMDIGAIGSEKDVRRVERSVESADVLIAVIGPRWLQATDREGRRLLDMPLDSVRLEIEAALRSGTRVIPTLVQGGRMPSADQLPEPLKGLARRHPTELTDATWRYDVPRLITILESDRPSAGELTEVVTGRPPDHAAQRPRLPWFRRWLEAREQKKAGEDEVSSVERELE